MTFEKGQPSLKPFMGPIWSLSDPQGWTSPTLL
jgi:hypothetical protein